MQEFLLVIHRDLTSANPAPTPEQMKEALKPYQDWVAGIAAQDRLVAPPKRWDVDGRVIRHDKKKEQVLSGPYAEGKEIVGGWSFIEADSFERAVEIAREVPMFASVEVIEITTF